MLKNKKLRTWQLQGLGLISGEHSYVNISEHYTKYLFISEITNQSRITQIDTPGIWINRQTNQYCCTRTVTGAWHSHISLIYMYDHVTDRSLHEIVRSAHTCIMRDHSIVPIIWLWLGCRGDIESVYPLLMFLCHLWYITINTVFCNSPNHHVFDTDLDIWSTAVIFIDVKKLSPSWLPVATTTIGDIEALRLLGTGSDVVSLWRIHNIQVAIKLWSAETLIKL